MTVEEPVSTFERDLKGSWVPLDGWGMFGRTAQPAEYGISEMAILASFSRFPAPSWKRFFLFSCTGLSHV